MQPTSRPCATLRGAGVPVSEIADGSPGPSREMRVDDPDGYCLMVAEMAGAAHGT